MSMSCTSRQAVWIQIAIVLAAACLVVYGVVYMKRATGCSDMRLVAANGLYAVIWIAAGLLVLREAMKFGDRHGV